jgi:hypothetical protein
MVILDITKSQSTPMTKVRPLLLAHMKLMHTDECRLDYVMLQLELSHPVLRTKPDIHYM